MWNLYMCESNNSYCIWLSGCPIFKHILGGHPIGVPSKIWLLEKEKL